MYYIVKLVSNANGSRPPIQPWQLAEPPEGFALCPTEFTQYFVEAKGFVNITVQDGIVTSMTENTEAIEAWEASLPPEPAPEPTPDEDQDAMLVDLMTEVALLKLGIYEM